MKIYLVGGAVRDYLLGIFTSQTEKDWVVIGSSPEEMLCLGYKPAGKDFPVFLHPDTHEEYALARTERKTAKGYHGFIFHASPDVTLEEDLQRRDLTVNAMAMESESRHVIDPFGGQKDLSQKIFRHVSPAFIEDPVRILRLARFMARFGLSGFSIAPETVLLMKKIVEQGEVDALVSSRVWREMQRALSETCPEKFFETLYQCGALTKLWPRSNTDLSTIHYTKINYINADILLNSRETSMINFARLLLIFSVQDIKYFCAYYPVPKDYTELALTANITRHFFEAEKLSSEDIINLLEKTDAYRRPERFKILLKVFENFININIFQTAFTLTQVVAVDKWIKDGITGKLLGEKIKQQRLQILENLNNNKL